MRKQTILLQVIKSYLLKAFIINKGRAHRIQSSFAPFVGNLGQLGGIEQLTVYTNISLLLFLAVFQSALVLVSIGM